MTDPTPQERREQVVALARGEQGVQGEHGDQGERGEQGKRGEPLSRAVRRALIYLFTVAVAIGVANLFWTSHQANATRAQFQAVIQADDHRWCSTLDLLTSHPAAKPADPKANPSRVQAYQLYTDFLNRRHSLGCG